MEIDDYGIVKKEDCVELIMTPDGIKKYGMENFLIECKKRNEEAVIGRIIDIPTIGSYLYNDKGIKIAEVFGDDNVLSAYTPHTLLNTKENMDRLDRYLALSPEDRNLYDKVHKLFMDNVAINSWDKLDITELYSERGDEFLSVIDALHLNNLEDFGFEMSSTIDHVDGCCYLYMIRRDFF